MFDGCGELSSLIYFVFVECLFRVENVEDDDVAGSRCDSFERTWLEYV